MLQNTPSPDQEEGFSATPALKGKKPAAVSPGLLRPEHLLVRRAPLVLLPGRLPSPHLLELTAHGHGAVVPRAALGMQVEQAPGLLAQLAAAVHLDGAALSMNQKLLDLRGV